MRNQYQVTIIVTVTDEQELYDAAKNTMALMGLLSAVEETLGGRDDPDVETCLRMVLDPGSSPPGTEIEDCTCERLASAPGGQP